MNYKFLTVIEVIDILPNNSRISLWLDGKFLCDFYNDSRIMRKFVSDIKADVVRLEAGMDDELLTYRIDATSCDSSDSYE